MICIWLTTLYLVGILRRRAKLFANQLNNYTFANFGVICTNHIGKVDISYLPYDHDQRLLPFSQGLHVNIFKCMDVWSTHSDDYLSP